MFQLVELPSKGFVDGMIASSDGECRARSECTHVPADLPLHTPQTKSVDRRLRVNFLTNKQNF